MERVTVKRVAPPRNPDRFRFYQKISEISRRILPVLTKTNTWGTVPTTKTMKIKRKNYPTVLFRSHFSKPVTPESILIQR